MLKLTRCLKLLKIEFKNENSSKRKIRKQNKNLIKIALNKEKNKENLKINENENLKLNERSDSLNDKLKMVKLNMKMFTLMTMRS